MEIKTTQNTEFIELVVFTVADIICGLPVHEVQEIKRMVPITPVHNALDYVRGVINLRGHIVTIIDVRYRLEYPVREFDPSMRIVIVKQNDEQIGLLVDTIEDAITAHTANILPPPANVQGAEGRFFTGILRMTDRLIAIINTDTMLDKN